MTELVFYFLIKYNNYNKNAEHLQLPQASDLGSLPSALVVKSWSKWLH